MTKVARACHVELAAKQLFAPRIKALEKRVTGLEKMAAEFSKIREVVMELYPEKFPKDKEITPVNVKQIESGT